MALTQTGILGVLGLVSLVCGWLLMFILPAIRPIAWGIVGLGALLVAAAAVLDFRRLRGALASRRGRLGVGSTVMVALFSGIVVLVNTISIGYYHRFDFTGLAQFTLTSQTREVLAGLEEPVEVVSFFAPHVPVALSSYANNLLDEYRNHSEHLTVRHVDPDVRPDLARRFGVDRVAATFGAVVFRGEKGQRHVLGLQVAAGAEHAFTSAILEVTGVRQRTVYFLSGQGESSIHGNYSHAAAALRDHLFRVLELDLASIAAVPDDAAALVLAGPREPIKEDGLSKIRAYLESGGRVLALFDPNPPYWLRELLAEWWMRVEDGLVIDPASYVTPNQESILVPRARNSFGLEQTYFPGATAVIPADGIPQGVELVPLVWTSPEAWLARDVAAYPDELVFDEETDRSGPLAIGALLSVPVVASPGAGRATRLAGIGDSDFASTPHFRNGANGELFLNVVSWLTEGQEIISVDRKVLVTRRLLLSPEQARFLHVSSIGLLPLLVLAAGCFVWWRRR